MSLSIARAKRAIGDFSLEVGNLLPAWFSLTEWIAWPLLVVALYALLRRKSGP